MGICLVLIFYSKLVHQNITFYLCLNIFGTFPIYKIINTVHWNKYKSDILEYLFNYHWMHF